MTSTIVLYGPDNKPIGALAATRPEHVVDGDPVVDALYRRGLLPLVDEVCALRGVTRAEVCGRARTKAVAQARAEVWFRMRTMPGRAYSLTEIGIIFGRAHETVMSGIKAHVARMVGVP